MQGLSSDLKQFFQVKNNLLTSVHNDTDTADDPDDADDTDDYNRVIGIALLKAFSCAYKIMKFQYTATLVSDNGNLCHEVGVIVLAKV